MRLSLMLAFNLAFGSEVGFAEGVAKAGPEQPVLVPIAATQPKCESQMQQNHCDEYFSQHPEEVSKKRDCSADWPATIWSIPGAVGSGGVQVGAGVMRVGANMATLPYTVAVKLHENAKLQTSCEDHIDCLRELARQAAFVDKDGKLRSDEEIKDYGYFSLLQKSMRVREMARQDKSYAQKLEAMGVPIEEDNFLIPVAEKYLRDQRIKVGCYNPKARAEMIGYALGYLAGSVLAAKGLGKIPRGSAGIADSEVAGLNTGARLTPLDIEGGKATRVPLRDLPKERAELAQKAGTNEDILGFATKGPDGKYAIDDKALPVAERLITPQKVSIADNAKPVQTYSPTFDYNKPTEPSAFRYDEISEADLSSILKNGIPTRAQTAGVGSDKVFGQVAGDPEIFRSLAYLQKMNYNKISFTSVEASGQPLTRDYQRFFSVAPKGGRVKVLFVLDGKDAVPFTNVRTIGDPDEFGRMFIGGVSRNRIEGMYVERLSGGKPEILHLTQQNGRWISQPVSYIDMNAVWGQSP
jgi:hypothetical protein